jgi:hypothetical protein
MVPISDLSPIMCYHQDQELRPSSQAPAASCSSLSSQLSALSSQWLPPPLPLPIADCDCGFNIRSPIPNPGLPAAQEEPQSPDPRSKNRPPPLVAWRCALSQRLRVTTDHIQHGPWAMAMPPNASCSCKRHPQSCQRQTRPSHGTLAHACTHGMTRYGCRLPSAMVHEFACLWCTHCTHCHTRRA